MIGLVHDVTRNEQCRSAPGKLVKLLPQVHPQDGVKADRGFVQHEHFRCRHQCAGKRYASPLTTGQIAAQGGPMVVEAYSGHGLVRGGGVHAVKRAEVSDVVDDAQIVVDGCRLRHVPDALAQRSRAGRLPEHRDAAPGDELRSDDAAHQRGLAAARGPEQAGDGAAGDSHGQVMDGGAFPAHDAQVVDDNDRLDASPQ